MSQGGFCTLAIDICPDCYNSGTSRNKRERLNCSILSKKYKIVLFCRKNVLTRLVNVLDRQIVHVENIRWNESTRFNIVDSWEHQFSDCSEI